MQTVGVTVTSGAGVDQCSDTHEETVTVEALPVVAFSGVTGACEGQAVVWNDASSTPSRFRWTWTGASTMARP